METSVWLWLYDRRWFFGIKPPSLFKIWSLPLFSNAFFFVSLLYYTSSQSDQCYSTFKGWIFIRLGMLVLTVLGILSIAKKTFTSKNNEYPEMKNYKLINPVLIKNYNYWITRKVLISFPGLTLLILGLLNWYWTIHGLNLVYSEYEGGALAGCTSFVHSVVWINLMITGLVSLPVVWVLFWMLIIKLTCILLGVISPSLLIKMKKFTA